MSVLKIRPCISVLASILLIILPLLTIITPITSDNTAYALESDTSLSNADASFVGEANDDLSGYSVASAGDTNDDGYDDFLIGAWANDVSGTNSGQTYLILGKSSNWDMDFSLSNADASFIGENASDYSSYGLAAIGDINGDGYDDFLIGAHGYDVDGDETGKAYLILGKSAADWGMDYSLANADASFIGENAGDHCGKVIASAGDVNNDGYDDFLIGSRDNDEGGNSRGQTYLILGKSVADWGANFDIAGADASFIGEANDDLSGYSVASAGDINGDGYDDFSIGAAGNDDSADGAGQTYLILGNSVADWGTDYSLANADASFIGENAGDHSGSSVAPAGDVNSDGYDDFLVGAKDGGGGAGVDPGETYLLLGNSAADWGMDYSLTNSDASFIGEDAGAHSGDWVAPAGDVNADGYDDFLVIARYDALSTATQIHIILGNSAADWGMDFALTNANVSFVGEGTVASYGLSSASVGDVNADGYDDLVIGDPGNEGGGDRKGQTYLILGEPTWRSEVLASSGYLGGKLSSLAFDNSGNPAISYCDDTGTALMYTHWNGSSWDTETVDSSGDTGYWNSLAFDNSGNPAISYMEIGSYDLKYAHWNGNSWEKDTVVSSGQAGWLSSLAFDNDDNPAISYWDQTYGIRFAHWNGSSWDIETVVSPGSVNWQTSLVFDNSGDPAISYIDNVNYLLKLARWNGISWDTTTIDSSCNVSGHFSLVLNEAGNLVISYWDKTNGDLKYALLNGNSWVPETVDASGELSGDSYISLAFDGINNPSISYYNATDADLKFAHWNGSSWDIETVDSTGDVGLINSLAYDNIGNPAISYWDKTNGDLKYAYLFQINLPDQPTNTSPANTATDVSLTPTLQSSAFSDPDGDDTHAASQWHITTTLGDYSSPVYDSGTSTINKTSIAIAADTLEGNTTYYWRIRHQDNNGAWSDWSAETSFTTVDITNPTVTLDDIADYLFELNNIAGTASDNVGLDKVQVQIINNTDSTYWDGSTWQAGPRWNIESMDTSDNVGDYSSLAFDGSGNPAISYHDYTNGTLKYAHWNGSSWDIEMVHTADYANVGMWSSLAFDGEGNPSIAFQKYSSIGSPESLWYTHWNGTTWDTELVDRENYSVDFGRYNSLAFDSNDNPAISYHVNEYNSPKFAYWNGSRWNIEFVGSGNNKGNYTSMVFDSDDNPAISYTTGGLHYTSWNGSSWDNVFVASSRLGQTSLALDKNGNPGISYPSQTDGDLMFARFNGSSWDTEIVDGDTVETYGLYNSLAFDSNGNPAISYTDETDYSNFKLKYARWNGSSWDIEFVDTSGAVGENLSLAFNSSDNPAISYRDNDNGDLKFARWISATWLDATDTTSWTFDMPSLNEGDEYTVIARSIDSEGNISSATSDEFMITDVSFDGWYISESSVTTATKDDTVTVIMALNGCTPGSYTLRIRRDVALSADETVEELTFDLDGTLSVKELSFTPVYITDESNTNGYHADLLLDEDVIWTLTDSYPPRLTVINQTPNQATNTSPADNDVRVSLTPTLQSSAFSDPDTGGTHIASQWQITTIAGDYSSPIYDSGADATNKTSLMIPVNTLSYMTTYYWRVRHKDNYGNWSDWSIETSFRTEDIVEETIGNGGGTIETPDQNIIIVLPTGAVDNDTPIILTVAQPEQMPPTPSGCTLCDTVFTIEGVETLNSMATITVNYTADDLAAAGGNAGLLSLYRYDEDNEQWVRLPTTVNTTEQTLTVTTDHFSLWATMVRPLSFWEQSRMWFLIAGAIVAGVLLLLFIRASRRKLIIAGEFETWEEEGYDLADWKDKLGIK